MSKLTIQYLKSLKEKDIGCKLFDGNGLYGQVRLQKKGIVVTFEYRFKYQGKTHTVACAKWPAKSLAEIRSIRDIHRELAKQGINPIDQRKVEKLTKANELTQSISDKQAKLAALAARRTFEDAIAEWQALELVQRKDAGKEIIRAIRKDILSALGKLALVDVSRSMLMDALYQVVERGARVMANHLFTGLRQFYGFAIAREWISINPLSSLSKDKIGGREKERDRYLTENEIIELKNRLSNSGLSYMIQTAIWIMLSTCCRVGELSKARWEDINFSEDKWFIPAKNTKNSREHTVFLSAFAKRQFQKLEAITGESEWCFPSRNKLHHINVQSISKQIKDRIRDKPIAHRANVTGILRLPGGDWTPHDLRRTSATMMGNLGIMGEVIERCLNHIEQNKLKRIYQRHELKNEQRQAWDLLGNRLEKLIAIPISAEVTWPQLCNMQHLDSALHSWTISNPD